MKRMLLLFGGLMLATILVACGSSGDDNNNTEDPSNNNGNNNTTADVDEAESLYKDNCASCHGGNLEGDSGPNLETIGNDLSEDEIREQIKEGGSIMPEEILKGEEADQVAAWLAEKK